MNEPTITCWQCKTAIKLTESLAAPLLESTRREYELKIVQKEEEVSKREESIRKQQGALAKSQDELDQCIADKLKTERQNIVIAEAKKAREALGDEISKVQQEKAAVDDLLKDRDAKLAEARKNELDTRRQYELKISQKEDEIGKREALVREQQANLAKSQEEMDQHIAEKLKSERLTIATAEAKKAREALTDEISKVQQEKAAVDVLLKERDTKLAEAHKNELDLRKARQLLLEEKDQFELEKQRAIDTERTKIRESVQKDADEKSRLKIAEKDKTITDLQVKLQEALRKAEQGSQQLQGEIQELELEALLRLKFPRDIIDPVPKGEYGGDALHRVYGPFGQFCGTILWESKRTKNWSDGWLSKLREDQRVAKADIAIIMTQVLPKNVEFFDLVDGVWIIESRYLIPVTVALRQLLIELSASRQVTNGQQTKMELVYQYLTGSRFRHRVEAIVEKFTDMKDDLDKERKVMTKLWAKREEQIRGVIESTAGMYGDLQGIAGKTLQEIEGLEIKLLGQEEVCLSESV